MPNDSVQAVRSYYRAVLPFYEKESEDRGDLAFWRALVAEQEPGCILELGAGTGRVTAALRDLAPVVAVDLSPEMLKRAADRLKQQAGEHAFAAELIVADMRRLALGRRFDLIVAASDPFSHITRQRERQVALRAIAKHLQPGGRLVIEGLYRSGRRRTEAPERTTHGIAVREIWDPIGVHDCWRARYLYREGAELTEAEFVARAWNPLEAGDLLKGCGLELQEMWGDFDRHPFRPDAERMILVAGLRER